MLLIFTSVWQTDKSLLPKQTEILWSLRDPKWCAQEAPRGLGKYLAACKLKWSHSDTNHLPGWPVENFSFSSPWQPPVYCPDIAATLHTHPTHTQATPSSSAHWHCRQLGTSSRQWPLAHEPWGQGGVGEAGKTWALPQPTQTLSLLLPSPCEKSTCWHYIAFHYLYMKESPLVGTWWCRMKHRHKSRLVLT